MKINFSIRGAVQAEGTGALHALNLAPAYWSRGLGSELFLASVNGLCAMGYERAYLWVADGNDRAIRCYERHGWCQDGETKQDARFDPPLLKRRFSVSLRQEFRMGRYFGAVRVTRRRRE